MLVLLSSHVLNCSLAVQVIIISTSFTRIHTGRRNFRLVFRSVPSIMRDFGSHCFVITARKTVKAGGPPYWLSVTCKDLVLNGVQRQEEYRLVKYHLKIKIILVCGFTGDVKKVRIFSFHLRSITLLDVYEFKHWLRGGVCTLNRFCRYYVLNLVFFESKHT